MKIQTTEYVTTCVMYKAQKEAINVSDYTVHYLLKNPQNKPKPQLIMVLSLKLSKDFIFKSPFAF